MTDREKLIELLGDCKWWGTLDDMADHLIANGVTVQDGKPLEEFLHLIDAYKGLKAKYLVFKADTGKVVDNCFILRPDKDAAAVEALRAYANATDNKTLSEDIYIWVGKGGPVQQWIPVTERLPEEKGSYLTARRRDVFVEQWNGVLFSERGHHAQPTHWMTLPEPPKGE